MDASAALVEAESILASATDERVQELRAAGGEDGEAQVVLWCEDDHGGVAWYTASFGEEVDCSASFAGGGEDVVGAEDLPGHAVEGVHGGGEGVWL